MSRYNRLDLVRKKMPILAIAMENAGYKSVRHMCYCENMNYDSIISLINGNFQKPLIKNNKYNYNVLKLSKFTCEVPETLFPKISEYNVPEISILNNPYHWLYDECTDNQELVKILLDMVDVQTKHILMLHYGLIDRHCWTLREISEIYRLSHQRIGQIKNKGILMLHKIVKYMILKNLI